jgi:hypothetical protein
MIPTIIGAVILFSVIIYFFKKFKLYKEKNAKGIKLFYYFSNNKDSKKYLSRN